MERFLKPLGFISHIQPVKSALTASGKRIEEGAEGRGADLEGDWAQGSVCHTRAETVQPYWCGASISHMAPPCG